MSPPTANLRVLGIRPLISPAILAEELFGALGNGQQAHHPLPGLDHATFPFRKLDAKGLREAANHVKHQREALGLAAGTVFVIVVIRGVLVFVLAACVVHALPIGGLQRPEEECR